MLDAAIAIHANRHRSSIALRTARNHFSSSPHQLRSMLRKPVERKHGSDQAASVERRQILSVNGIQLVSIFIIERHTVRDLIAHVVRLVFKSKAIN